MSSQRVAGESGKRGLARGPVLSAPAGGKRPMVESSRGELALIERIRARAANGTRSPLLRLGIGDDCAILAPPPGHEVLVTTDFSLEGRHFRRDWHSAASAGHRTLARGLSDLAAMGAEPMAAFLSLALPRSLARSDACSEDWLSGFLDGFLALAKAHGVPLAGGDMAESPGDMVLADVVLLGSAPAGTALRRSGARPGDALYCTGTLGGAAQELAHLAAAPGFFGKASAAQQHPHLFPEPRLAAGKILRKRRLATACIDLSDGLSTDLAHLCAASGVAAEVEQDALPLALALRRTSSPVSEVEAALHRALDGGEDYELLFTAAAEAKLPRRLGGSAVTRIGRIVKARKNFPQVVLVSGDGLHRPLPPRGWEHLR